MPAALVCAVLETILWEQPERYGEDDEPLLKSSFTPLEGFRIVGWTGTAIAFPPGTFNTNDVRVEFPRLSCTKAKQFNIELFKQARHIRKIHEEALAQLKPGAEIPIEKAFGQWLGREIANFISNESASLELHKILRLAWDMNLPVTQKEHVEVSFVMKIIHALNLCLA
jgi:hypothetical protein